MARSLRLLAARNSGVRTWPAKQSEIIALGLEVAASYEIAAGI